MQCTIELLDSQEEVWFTVTKSLPGDYILKLAAEHKASAMAKGMELFQKTIPFFGAKLARVIKNSGTEEQIDKAIFDFVMATVVVDSCLGTSDEVLLGRNFNLVAFDNGAVQYDLQLDCDLL
ncbi:hypothetical protein SAMN04490179_4823 [Pseudomonas antarctica]|uniref:Uncharacterized protein n=1 Tax=Pseudomonas antarctica TaxID=219572 RepID=A0A1H0CEM1_9PSED|nr:hypothetical protein [Pseudomonas antarctica]KAF2405929.1 hypothetical protein PSAN_51500 [Pseudomonas antarctica]SDN56292.1 hypothetical protein SAMN04490179_4823 [Pseudomonas antarctica]